MKITLFLLVFAVLFTISFSVDAFAQASYDVNIPTGASDSSAPYFWQSEKDGSTTGIVEIKINDKITWKNADTAFHDVTSGSAEDGADGIFASGPFGPGKSFTHKFSEIGFYPYYCSLHPWMEGAVIVTAGYSIVPNVGKQVGDGATFFDVEYDFNRVLDTAAIDEEQKSITFEIVGDAKSENHELELLLPSELIDGPFVIWVDGEKISDFEHVKEGDLNTLFITLDADSEILTIVGTKVVPEFGPVVIMILGVSIVTMILFSQRLKPQIRI